MLTKLEAPIEGLRAFLVRLPLPKPIQVFGRPLHEREFIFAEVQAGGKVGRGYGLSRSLPLLPLIQTVLAPQVLGQPLGSIRAIWDRLRADAAMVGETGVFARALSVVELALWDVLGHVLEVPLWRLWGGAQAKVPTLAICGYYQADAVKNLCHEVESLLEVGYRAFKIPFGADDELDQRRLSAFRALAGAEVTLALDASAAYTNVKQALAALERARPYQISFLEDPFPVSKWQLSLQLAQQTSVPIAFGEAPSDLASLRLLAQGIDVYRPDLTHHLGVTGTMQGLALAQENGKLIFPHYFPDLHAPLLAGVGGAWIEEAPRQADTVGFWRLRATSPRILEGVWQMTEQTGFGIDWDLDALAHYTVKDTPHNE